MVNDWIRFTHSGGWSYGNRLGLIYPLYHTLCSFNSLLLKVEIVDLPITDGDFHISVQLPEGMDFLGMQ